MNKVSARLRVDLTPGCAIGPGKIALLEAVASTGSLSGAARRIKMSYRRAWMLLENLNTSFRQPVVELSKGGRGGGGATLTPFGTSLVKAYRALESHVARRARSIFRTIAKSAVSGGAKGAKRRPLQRAALH
jgi:molybdate transport system regulatory protein